MRKVGRNGGAPRGNRNAAKSLPGMRGQFYLNAADLAVLDAWLVEHGITPTRTVRLEAARTLLYQALRSLRDKQDEPPIIP
jgi:hypothetical protein